MPIIYYPQHSSMRDVQSLENISKSNGFIEFTGGGSISTSGISEVISYNKSWKLVSFGFFFSGTTSRDFSLKIKNGRNVVSGKNYIFWIQCKNPGTLWTKITLQSNGVRSGDELASDLEETLNSTTSLTEVGHSFSVSYNNSTGIFTITPASGEIAFFQESPCATDNSRMSTGGHLYGFTQNSSFASSITSDSAIKGLNDVADILSYSSSVVTSLYFDDGLSLSMDQGILISTNTAALNVTYKAIVQEIK